MPTLHSITLKKWYKKSRKSGVGSQESEPDRRKVYLFCDEFTNYNDTEIGIKAIRLLEKLGYEVIIPEHIESGRASCQKVF
jgi:Fe-S oxidoreductase